MYIVCPKEVLEGMVIMLLSSKLPMLSCVIHNIPCTRLLLVERFEIEGEALAEVVGCPSSLHQHRSDRVSKRYFRTITGHIKACMAVEKTQTRTYVYPSSTYVPAYLGRYR
jgi:hypothetical protein